MKYAFLKCFLLVAILCWSGILRAQDKKVAMLEPIASSEGVTLMVKGMVRGELTKSLSRAPGFSAFTRVDIDQMMKEINFQESGMVNDEQRRKLGQMSGADYVCISKILKEEKAYYIEASLVHIETGKIHNPGTAFTEGGIKNVNLACQQVAADMVGKKVEMAAQKSGSGVDTNTGMVKSAYPKVDYNDNFKISILSLRRRGSSVELFFSVKNEGRQSQYFSCIGYNGWEFKLYTEQGDVIVASKQPVYGIKEEFPPGLTLKRKVVFRNVPGTIKSFSHLVFVSRPAYTGSAGRMTHTIRDLPIENN